MTTRAGQKRIWKNTVFTTRKNCYTIVIRRGFFVYKFLKEIGFSIPRKQLGLKKIRDLLG